MKELISIVVPVYNVADLLPRTINSILAQTYKNFELILVNDGSSDNSGVICDEYTQKDNRIRVFHNDNMGAGEARKFGVNQAKGEWIMFVDGDDTIPSDSIEKLISKDNGEYDIISGTINENNLRAYHHVKEGELSKDEYISLLLETKTFTGPVAKLFDKKCFEQSNLAIPRNIKNNEDMLMLIMIAKQCRKIYIDNNIVCYNYLWRDTSASKSVIMPLYCWIDLFNLIQKELGELLQSDRIRVSFIKYRLKRLFLCCILQGTQVGLNNSYIANFYNECKDCMDLDSFDNKVVNLLNDMQKQKRLYQKHKLIKNIKKLIKNIIKKIGL